MSIKESVPVASILVTAYKHGPYIRECLESLVRQKCSFSYEILVGEDCSPDGTREIVVEMAERFPHLIRAFLRPANLGAFANLEQLIASARGTYIAFCEGDDYWHRSEKLQQQVEILSADLGISLVCCDVDTLIMSSGRHIQSVMRRIGQWQNFPNDVALGILTRRVNISLCSVCLRRETLQKIIHDNPDEFSKEHPMSDIQLFIEASRLGRIHPMQESLATYRAIDDSATRSEDPRKAFDFMFRSLPVFEHYVDKLGYGPAVMNRVRMTHLSALIDIARRQMNPELIAMARELASEKHIPGSNAVERFSLWCLASDARLRIFGGLLPVIGKFTKLRRVFRRLTPA